MEQNLTTINVRVGEDLKSSLTHEATLRGISVSELIRERLLQEEKARSIPDGNMYYETMGRVEFDLRRAEEYFRNIYSGEGPSLDRYIQLHNPFKVHYGEALNKEQILVRDRDDLIRNLLDALCKEVEGRVRALKGCRSMLRVIEEMTKQSEVSNQKLSEYLRSIPYEYPRHIQWQ